MVGYLCSEEEINYMIQSKIQILATNAQVCMRLPKSVKEYYALDEKSNNNLWKKEIGKEVIKVKTAVAESSMSPENLVGHQDIDLHMVFDIKLGGNYRHKSRLVTGGHKTKSPISIMYSLVVLRDSVRIFLLIAALKDSDPHSADIENDHLKYPWQ